MTLNISRKIMLAISLLALILLSYANTLFSPFTLDDFHSFINSSQIYTKDLSLQSLSQLSNTVFGKSRLIPIISFAIDHHFAKGNIIQYHITNILIHLLNAAAMFWLLSLLLNTRIGKNSLSYSSTFVFCLATTAIWSLNPVQTNAVTYLVQRMASMSTLFYLLSLSCYLYGRTRAGKPSYFPFLLSGFFAFLAFMSKQNSATLPIAIIMTEYILINPENLQRIFSKIKWQHYLLLLLLLILASPIINAKFSQLLSGYSNRHFTLGERLLTEGRVVIFYISLLLLPLPARMNMEHDFSVSTSLLSPITTGPSILALFLLLIFAIRVIKVYPLISFGILWYFLNITLESTVLPLELVFEHRNYLPSIGLFIAIASACDHLANRMQDRLKNDELQKILVLLVVILVSLSSILTTVRNNDWRDHLSLAADSVTKSPHKPRALTAYGTALAFSKRHDEAIAYFEKAIAEGRHGYENYLDATGNIVASLSEMGKTEEAIARAEKYLKEIPDNINLIFYTKYLVNLAKLHVEAGNLDLAYEYNLMALRLEKPEDNGNFVTSMTYVLNKAYEEPKYRELYLLEKTGDKTTDVLLKVAQILLDVRDYAKALELINITSKMEPGNQTSNDLLARYNKEIELNSAAQKQSDITEHSLYKNDLSYRLSMKAIRFIFNYYSPLKPLAGKILHSKLIRHPNDQFVVLYLSRWQAETGRQDEALALIEKTLVDHPEFIPLLERAGRFYMQNDLKEKQLETYRKILSLYPGVGAWNQYETTLNRSEQMPGGRPGIVDLKGTNHV